MESRFLKIQIYNSAGSAVSYDNSVDTGWGISSGTASYEKLFMSNELRYGSLNSAMFEVQVYGIDENLENRKIVVTVIDDDVPTKLFTGFIQSAKSDITKSYRDIIAFDQAYYISNINVASWWNTFWTGKTSSTLSAIRNSLLTNMGITYTVGTLINDSMVITNTLSQVTKLSFGTVIEAICIIQNVTPSFNEEGTLEFLFLGANEFDVDGNVEGLNSNWEDYTTEKITGIGVYDTSDKLAQLVGTGDNVYKIAGNIFLLGLSASALTTACTNILNGIKNIQYTPSDLSLIISDINCKVGSSYSTDYGDGYIFSLRYNGSLLINQHISCSAESAKLSDYVDDYNDEFITATKVASIERDIDEFKIDYADFKQDTEAEFSVMAGEVVMKVKQNGNMALVMLGDDPDESTNYIRFMVDVNNLNLTASNIINILAGNILNLTANNLRIESTNFNVTKDGDVTMRNFTASGAMNVTRGGKVGAYTVDANGNLIATYNGYTVTVSPTGIVFQSTVNGKLAKYRFDGVYIGDNSSEVKVIDENRNIHARNVYIERDGNSYPIMSGNNMKYGVYTATFSSGQTTIPFADLDITERPDGMVITVASGGAIVINYMYDLSTNAVVLWGSDSSSWSSGGGWLEDVSVKFSYLIITADGGGGTVTVGWVEDATGWRYRLQDGTYLSSTWETIGGKEYYFKSTSYMASDEYIKAADYATSGNLYYVERNGAYDGHTYGWGSDATGYYLEQKDGSWYAQSYWAKIDNYWYYFDENGYMVTGTVTIDNIEYTFGDDGRLQT